MLDIQTDCYTQPYQRCCQTTVLNIYKHMSRIENLFCTCHTRSILPHLSHTAGGLAKPPKKNRISCPKKVDNAIPRANNDWCSMILFASQRSQHCALTGPQHTYMQNVSLHGQPGNIDRVADFTDLFDQSHHVLIIVYMEIPRIAPRGKLHGKVSKLMQLGAHMVPDHTRG